MAVDRINSTLYGINLPDTFYINKQIKQSSNACDLMVSKADELQKQIKKTISEIRRNPIPKDVPDEEIARVKDYRNALTISKNAKIKERDLNLSKARSMEANADAYGDIYRLIAGTEPANYRKTQRLEPYKQLSEDEIKDMIERVWGESDDYPAPKADPTPVKPSKQLAQVAAVESKKQETDTAVKPGVSSNIEKVEKAETEKKVEIDNTEPNNTKPKEESEKTVSVWVVILTLILVVGFAWLGSFLF